MWDDAVKSEQRPGEKWRGLRPDSWVRNEETNALQRRRSTRKGEGVSGSRRGKGEPEAEGTQGDPFPPKRSPKKEKNKGEIFKLGDQTRAISQIVSPISPFFSYPRKFQDFTRKL